MEDLTSYAKKIALKIPAFQELNKRNNTSNFNIYCALLVHGLVNEVFSMR